MQKKMLLEIKPLIATKEMIRAAQLDKQRKETETYTDLGGVKRSFTKKHYNYKYYFDAVVEGEILKVAVFTRKSLIRGIKAPVYEIYLSKKENKYITYDVAEKKWRTAKIDMLDYDENYSYLYATQNYQTKKTRGLVNSYFGTGKNIEVAAAILSFQTEIRGEALQKKHRTELEAIDEVMNEVPELPKNFEKWVIKNCFEETLFYEREKPYKWPKVFCTHCGKWSDAPGKPEHGAKVICPSCKVEAVYRSWNKQKYVTDDVEVCILQKLNDKSGYILRKFDCRIERRHAKGWETLEFHKFETRRAKLTESFFEEELFEYGEYKYTGVNRWCYRCRRSSFGYYDHDFGNGIMYTENLKRVLKDKSFSGMDLKAFFKGGEKKRINPEFLLRRLIKYPFIEYVQKSGLTALVEDIMENREDSSLFDSSAQRIHEVLKLDKQRFNRMRQLNGNSKVLAALQYEKSTASRITDENIVYIKNNNIDIHDLCMNRTMMNLQKTLNFLERQQEKNGLGFNETRRYFRDYLDMAEERGMDITDEIVCKNSRMMEFHNRYLEEKNRENNIQRDKKVNDKFPKIREDYEKNTEHFGFETNEFVFLVPRKASDITKEGRHQHHCVGASDTYMSRMNEGSSFIIFLRHRQSKNIPYYTLEVTWDGKIRQFYSAYDRQPDKERVESILAEWKKEIVKRNAEIEEKQNMFANEFGLNVVRTGNQTLMSTAG